MVVTDAPLDPPGPRIVYVNRAFTRMTGYQPEEVVGQTPRLFQGPGTDRAVLDRMRRRLAEGRTFAGETVNYRKDGTAFVLAWTVSPIRDPQGTLVNWISTQHDVTERRRLERETLDISAREQRRIAGDLHDALQQQLLGTALHAKALAAALADEGSALAEEARELYGSMRESLKSLRTVVQGVVPVQANGDGLMVALTSLCARMTDLYGVPCTFVYETPIRLDDFELATQLYHVAQEAVVNALKHGHARHVEVSLARTDGHVALSVRDDGSGFEQGGAPTSGGMGLRLMAYRARLVGAQLEVASELGIGTTVTCTFKTPW